MIEKTMKSSLLIVEDDATMCEFLTDYLSLGRYEVTAVKNGNKAIRALRNHKYDVAIVDLKLPGKNGIEVIEKARSYYPDIKSIIITAYPSVETVAKSTELGAVDYLTKPFSLEELDIMLEEVMDEMPSERDDECPPPEKTEEIKKEITSMMEEKRIFTPSLDFVKNAQINNMRSYKAIYNWSIRDPEGFWGQMAEQLDWYKKWDKFLEYDFRNKPEVRFFIGGKINVCYNCLDRHLKTWRRNKAALIWQGERDEEVITYTYHELYREVCRFAKVLKKLGVKKGDTVTTYMPVIPELTIAMLACARIGAIHSVVFGGFSGESLRDRILDCGSKVLLTADGYHRNGQIIRCKDAIDVALVDCPDVRDVIIVKRLGMHMEFEEGRDRWWHDEISAGDISSY
ncbi:MAG: AMP-binding protein, partial [Dehalococcoidales bacterium]|nr:AMP-binding protein [Dehalococcoidales bacterium]